VSSEQKVILQGYHSLITAIIKRQLELSYLAMNCVNCNLQLRDDNAMHHADGEPARDFQPLAGVLTVLASIIMIFYGIGFSSAYIASANYYNTGTFYPALYIGVSNLCAFPFSLAGGIFLIKRTQAVTSMAGMVLALASGFVPVIALASSNYVWTNGLWIGLPLIAFPAVSLVAVATSKKAR
jgi:hypothetical protein